LENSKFNDSKILKKKEKEEEEKYRVKWISMTDG
jgi:hypothetical protein